MSHDLLMNPPPSRYSVACTTRDDIWAFGKVIDLLVHVIYAIARGDPV